jgi:signal transduction histidine kinase
LIAASAALVIIMAFLLYWSQTRVVTATKAKDLADEIVISVFERSVLRSDYLSINNLRAKNQWFSKQAHINELIQKASLKFDSVAGRKIIRNMLKENDLSAAVFQQIVENRESVAKGLRHQSQATEIENRLVGQLLLQTYDTIADTRRLQDASRTLIAYTQRTATAISLAFIVSVAAFVIIVAWNLGRITSKGIERLQQGAAAIGAGNLQHTIRLEGEDEFTELASAFNTMSGKLAESQAALEREIDERKRAADTIERLNRELNHSVSQLLASNQELEAFAYSVSHDLRAPLRGIDGWSQAFIEDYGDRIDAQGKEYLDTVRAEAQRMGLLIDALLTLSRVARSEMKNERVDVSGLAETVVEGLKHAEPDRKVNVRITPGMAVTGDPMLLKVLLQNLIGNAWKFTTLRENSEIDIGVTTDDTGRDVYFVRDNGAGFDMAFAGKLFTPFQRLHSLAEFPGTGIGLATVQRIVRRHGGTVWAEGTAGTGATFYFTIGDSHD